MKKTYQPSVKSIKHNWHLIDAKEVVLGRMSTDVVRLLMGKNKTTYTPHIDMGDHVVVINASQVRVTGGKESKKVYYKHSGYPGGFKKVKFEKVMKENPSKVIQLAVKRMLPDNRLKRIRLKRLHIYNDRNHPYEKKIN